MSVEAIAIVLNHARAKGTHLNILIGIANHEGDGGAWPSMQTLAKYGRCGVRRARQIVCDLLASGEVAVDYQAGGLASTPGHLRTNRYEVLVCCPGSCDGTSQHRLRGGRPIPRSGEAGFSPPSPAGFSPPPRLKPASEPSFEPPMEPSSEQHCRADPRFAAVDPDDDEQEGPFAGMDEPTEPTFEDWRTEDRELFHAHVGDAITTDGTQWKPEGTHRWDAFYTAFHDNPKKPIRWPGRFFAHLADTDQVEEWLAVRGLEIAA